MMSQGWNIKDQYRNTSRDDMPEETITSYGARLIALAQRNMVERGGSRTTVNGRPVFRIHTEVAANVEPLPDAGRQNAAMRAQLKGEIEKGIVNGSSDRERARAAYLAICLEFAPALKDKAAAQWQTALGALSAYPRVLQAIFYEAPFPAGDAIREKAAAAGLRKPPSQKLW
jgi:hypothetical protein